MININVKNNNENIEKKIMTRKEIVSKYLRMSIKEIEKKMNKNDNSEKRMELLDLFEFDNSQFLKENRKILEGNKSDIFNKEIESVNRLNPLLTQFNSVQNFYNK